MHKSDRSKCLARLTGIHTSNHYLLDFHAAWSNCLTMLTLATAFFLNYIYFFLKHIIKNYNKRFLTPLPEDNFLFQCLLARRWWHSWCFGGVFRTTSSCCCCWPPSEISSSEETSSEGSSSGDSLSSRCSWKATDSA